MNVTTPREHSETCGCRACVDVVHLSGQVDPCGWILSVRWNIEDELARAEGWTAEDYCESYQQPITDEILDCERDMIALCKRIDRKRFSSADDLVRYLQSLGLGEDFR